MSLSVSPINGAFVAEVDGISLADDHDASTIGALNDAILAHSILVFRDQKMSNDEHLRFSRKFGPSEIHTVSQYLLPDYPEIIVLANRGENGTKPIANGGAYWHSDITYKTKPPMGSILYGIEVPPEGGDTLYCDMYSAYDGLDEAMKSRLDGMKATHSYLERFKESRAGDRAHQEENFELSDEQKAEVPVVAHPIARTHPQSGRKALYINAGFTRGVVDMDESEGRALLDELSAHASQDRFIYRHKWRARDVVFWDNRCTMHRATEYDATYDRLMHRTTIQGDIPF
jgi:taurine dioxygenase